MPDNELAPIALFVYNRPLHTRQTLEALSKNHLAAESRLIIYADGPKNKTSPEEFDKITEVRQIIREKQWCKKIEIIESEKNHGLTSSIIKGVTKIVNKHGKVIVLEDDLLTSPWFLTYMNEGLNEYKDCQNVYSINGYMFPIEWNKAETVLLPYTSTWGWGTWKEKWEIFEINGAENKIIANNQFLANRFNLAHYDYTNMLLTSKHSWGIYWNFSVFKHNGLCLFPTKSMIYNIGFDGTGTNFKNETKVFQSLWE